MDHPAPGPFEFSAGEACLDFVNTWADRGRADTDLLRSYGDLLAFAGQGGLLEAATARRLSRMAAARPGDAGRVLASARSLRDALYGLFAARARGRALAPGDLDQLNGLLALALPHLRLEASGMDLRWRWADHDGALDAPLWPVLRSAAELLTSAELGLVRECDGAQCTWLFLDRSRSRSRRWCSMASCGNRAKARRHYQRWAGP